MAPVKTYPPPEPIPVCQPGTPLDLTVPRVPAVEQQFASLSEVGDYLACWPRNAIRSYRYADIDDENKRGLQNHFQGIERVRSNYLVISGGDPYEPASHLFIARMTSRPVAGAWGSNVFYSAEPPLDDGIVRTITIDPTFWHAGGMTVLGDVLVVPLENSGAGNSEIVFYNLADPERPTIFGHRIPRATAKAGAVALATLPSGRFLLAVWTDSDPGEPKRHLDLYLSHSTDFFDGFRAPPTVCVDGTNPFPQFQAMSFIWQDDGQLYLAGFDNSAAAAPVQPGTDRGHLYRVDLPPDFLAAGTGPVPTPVITPISQREFRSEDRQCNMDAAAGLHITPGGGLIVYGGYHYLSHIRFWDFPRKLVFKFNEYRAAVRSSAQAVTRIEEAWIELYDDTGFRGRHVSLFGPADARIEDYDKVRAQGNGFGNRTSSVRYQIPDGFAYVLYPRKQFGGDSSVVLPGTGRMVEIADLARFRFDNRTLSSRYETPAVARAHPGAIVITTSPTEPADGSGTGTGGAGEAPAAGLTDRGDENPMATKDVAFDPDGPALKAEIRCGHAQDGAYVLTLWEGNQIVQRWEGTFLNPEDDTYTLPGKARDHVGRLLQCKAEIGITPPITKYALLLTLWQGTQRLDVLTESGDAGNQTLVPVNLFARLRASQ